MLRALVVTALTAASTLIAVPTASAGPTAVECRLAAGVVLSDTSTRVQGIGAVRCTERVFHIGVAVELIRDFQVVSRARTVCSGLAQCQVETAAVNPPGRQQWCAVASGNYALSPTGAGIVLPPTRTCQIG